MKVVIAFLQKKTPVWATIATLFLAGWATWNGCQANKIANKTYKAEHIPRLKVSPLAANFYVPAVPEVPGQVKINMSAMIENVSETSAREIALNFETKDWYGHKTNLFKIYRDEGHPIPLILSMPKDSKMLYPSYAPDAPSNGLDGFLARKKPFELKLTLSWKDADDNKYIFVGSYELKSAPLPGGEHTLYFQPKTTYDSIKDGDLARDFAKKEL